MNKTEFASIIKEITNFYPAFKPLDSDALTNWYSRLVNCSYGDVRGNLLYHVDNSRSYPTIADLKHGLNDSDKWIIDWHKIAQFEPRGKLSDIGKAVYDMLLLEDVEDKDKIRYIMRDFERLYIKLLRTKNNSEYTEILEEDKEIEALPVFMQKKEENEDDEEPMDLWNVE